MAEFYRRVVEATAGVESFDERVRRALRAHLDLVTERGVLFVILQTKLSGRKLKRTVRQRLGPFIDFWSRQMEEEFAVDAAVAESVASAMLSVAGIFARSWHGKRLAEGGGGGLWPQVLPAGISPPPEAARDWRGLARDRISPPSQ